MTSDRFQKLTDPAYKIQPLDYKSHNGLDDAVMLPVNVILEKLNAIGLPFNAFCRLLSYSEYLMWLAILGVDDDYLFCNDMRYFWNVLIWFTQSRFSKNVIYRYADSTKFLKLKDGE